MPGSFTVGLGLLNVCVLGAPSIFLIRGQERSGHSGEEELSQPWD